MKQAIRALTWAAYTLWFVVMVFTATAVYSAVQFGVGFGEPDVSASGGTVTLSMPFSVENNGFYDVSDLNITTIIQEKNGALASNSSTIVPTIASGGKVNARHNISISLENMASSDLARLLFNDTHLDIDRGLALRYAGVIPVKISTTTTMPWGAPIYDLAFGNVTVSFYNITHVKAILPVSFENHSFFSLDGTMRAEIVNSSNQQVGVATAPIHAPQQSGYSTQLEALIPGSGVADLKEARVYFHTSVFSYGPMVIPIA